MQTFPTQDIDLAAAIMAVTGYEAEIERTPSSNLVNFVFPNDPAVQKAALSFCSGSLMVNARRFSIRRAWLYRLVKGGQR